MDHNQLIKFFPIEYCVKSDTREALNDILPAAQALAEKMNKLLQESPSKMEMMMRLFHLMRDVEMALKLDGPSNVKSMVITH